MNEKRKRHENLERKKIQQQQQQHIVNDFGKNIAAIHAIQEKIGT